jgi:hypothetical protein
MNQDVLKDVLIAQCFIAAIVITLIVVLRLVWFLVQSYIDRRSRKQDLISRESWRTAHFVKYSDNYTHTYSSRDISRPGYRQELFLVYADTDMLDLHELIELEDGTELRVQWEAKEKYAANGDGVYGYKFRIVTSNTEAFVNPEMLAEGKTFYIEPTNYKQK